MASARKVGLGGVGLGALICALGAAAPHAQGATWLENPGDNDFTNGANWNGGSPPFGKAVFGESTVRDITFGASWGVSTMQFNAGAPAYTFHITGPVTFGLAGMGIVNNSSNAPRFSVSRGAGFFIGGRSTMGNAVVTVTSGSGVGFFGNSAAGAATVRAGNGGAVLFFQNSTGGRGRFIAEGSGIIDFSGSFGRNGVVTAGSIEGDGLITIGDNFVVGGNNRSTEFSGVIEQCGCFTGSLTKVGTGTLTLSGNNTYQGSTTVSGGVLNVTGSIASSSGVFIDDGGVLSGDGRVSDVVVRAGGLLSPGTANLGKLGVQGNLTFRNGSGYLVHVTPTAASRTAVTGTAALNGTVYASLASGSYVTRQYTILMAAGGLLGKFDDVEVLNGRGFQSSLSYTNNTVVLNLRAALGLQADLGGNQQGVSTALNNYFNNGGALPPAFVPVFGLSGSALSNALAQLSGEVAAGASGVGLRATNVFLTQMLNPFGGGPNGSLAERGAARSFAAEQKVSGANAAYAAATPSDAAPASPWNVWAASFGGAGRIDGSATAGTQDLSLGSYGIAAGADYRVGAGTTVGFAVSGGHMSWDLSAGLGGGDTDVFQVGLYGVQKWGPAYIGAAVAAGWHGMETNRTVTLGGGGALSADFDAQSYGARIETGYRFDFAGVGVTPYAAVQALAMELPAYSEGPGTNPFALSYGSRSVSTVRTELGSWFETVLTPFQTGVLVGRARVAWAHDEGDNQGVTATFQSLPGASFVVNGAAAPRDSALLSAATELRFADALSVGLRLDSELAEGAAAYGVRGEVKMRW